MLALVMHTCGHVREHARTIAETLLVNTAMLALLGFHAVVGASLRGDN